jgi:hypothetical protein
LAKALEYEPVLGIGVLAVKAQACVGIVENSTGFIEADAVLAKIRLGLADVPFKAHDRSPST